MIDTFRHSDLYREICPIKRKVGSTGDFREGDSEKYNHCCMNGTGMQAGGENFCESHGAYSVGVFL